MTYFNIHPGQPAKYSNEGNFVVERVSSSTYKTPMTLLANKPIKFGKECGSVFYFEIKIKKMASKDRNIIIGLCDGDQKKEKLLGYGKQSFGYSANSRVLNNLKDSGISSHGKEFGTSFEEKDIVGCGFLIDKREIFFTRNGTYLGSPFNGITLPETLYPAICL
mmetsp:Transcript_5593/g.8820  ORF Transcript_5593/g.8820 Transcript_5593/m.8820 type:complete len:164 (+) Transcript_5593:51-542(+)|eukprot:CAMPEP_0170480562 /NCGR_PEP_ID=MMETSP0208-20121228/1354_1 /TAXON_ID=197538 /ORGANISM="Strombidium inclinatum, Strain S3" /LENGTH=163 /DNA_ID=CAMNT_0010753131 /DNA_START=368 /DNA_END=859 /DNA_ORIENTATION=+